MEQQAKQVSQPSHKSDPALTADSKPLVRPPVSFPDQPPNPDKAGVAGGSLASFGQRSYMDFCQTVLLRVELATPGEIKAVGAMVYVVSILAIGAQMALLGNKVHDTNSQHLFTSHKLESANLAIASLCIAILAIEMALYAGALHRTRGKRWSRRKRTLCLLAFSKVVIMLVSNIFYMAPNAYIIARSCAWFDPFIRWGAFVRMSCLNALVTIFLIEARNSNRWKRRHWRGDDEAAETGRALAHKASMGGHPLDDPKACIDDDETSSAQTDLVLDGPWYLHWPEMLLGAVIQSYFLVSFIYLSTTGAEGIVRSGQLPVPECETYHYKCSKSKPLYVLLLTSQGILGGYFIFYCIAMYRGFQHLWHNPYNANKLSNVAVRLQLRQTLPAFLVTEICLALSFFVAPGSCASLFNTFLGVLPQQLMLSAMVASSAFYFQPKLPSKRHPFPQDWLQEFAWSEASLDATKADRDRWGAATAATSLPGRPSLVDQIRSAADARSGVSTVPTIAKEPMFCMETAIKAAFWSHLVYNYPPTQPLIVEELPHAVGAWSLDTIEMMEEESTDSRAMIAWNQSFLLLVFRGTASMTNALTDLQAWRTPHPPRRGSLFLCSQPLVHHGFLKAWRAGGFHTRLLARVRELLDTGALDRHACQVLVTGHSLGGAIAQLCAFDVQKEFGFAKLACYTIGAPRPGNHSFARDYDAMVPNTWHVVNDQDAVPRTGKLVTMYKRPGHRVIINLLGDLICRPAPLESSLRNRPGGGKINDHMLGSYQRSFAAILASQWGDKHQRGGRKGVLEIIRNPHVLYILQQVHFRDMVLQAAQLGHVKLGKERKPQTAQEQAAELAEDVGKGLAEGAADVLGTVLPFIPQPGQVSAAAVAKAEEAAGKEIV